MVDPWMEVTCAKFESVVHLLSFSLLVVERWRRKILHGRVEALMVTSLSCIYNLFCICFQNVRIYAIYGRLCPYALLRCKHYLFSNPLL